MQEQMVVEHIPTGRIGVTTSDLPGYLSCNGPGEVTVVYNGTTVGDGTNENELRVVGPENAVADFHKCGAGKGSECCIFLTSGPNGTSCERFSSLRWSLIFRTMTAERNPPEPYPACQKFPAKSD